MTPGTPRLTKHPTGAVSVRAVVVTAVPVVVAVVVAMAGAGCGRTSTSQRDARAAAQIRAAQARTVARQAGLGADVQTFLAKAASASSVTYTVVYDQGGGQSTTVIAQAPDRRIDVVGASGAGSTDRVIVRGTDTYVCHLDAARWTCVSGVVSAPTGPFTPEAITQTIQLLAQLSQTYDFTVSPRRMLGLDASCLAATAPSRGGTRPDGRRPRPALYRPEWRDPPGRGRRNPGPGHQLSPERALGGVRPSGPTDPSGHLHLARRATDAVERSGRLQPGSTRDAMTSRSKPS